MKRKLTSLFVAVFAAILLTSTVFAGSVKLSRVTFSLGTDTISNSGGLALMAVSEADNNLPSPPSLVANGTLTGLGKDDVQVVIDASGFPEVTCINQGGNQAPGQNPPKFSASGQQMLVGLDLRKKNGTSPFNVETNDPQDLDPIEYGCPNANWTASIDFIYWDEATITVLDTAIPPNVLAIQEFTCTTTRSGVSCTPVN